MDTKSVASLMLKRQRPRDVLQAIDVECMAGSSPDLDLLHIKAVALEALGNIPQAFLTYQGILRQNPHHIESLVSLGLLYKSRQMLDEALSTLNQAHLIAPDNTKVKESLALVLTDVGTRAKSLGTDVGQEIALRNYQQASILFPNLAAVHYNLGVIASEMRQHDLALEHYHRAVTAEPAYPQALCNIGVIYKDRGDLTTAIAYYERALSFAPNFAIVRANLAVALTDLGTRVKVEGSVAGAIELYERALAFNPRYTAACYNLGVAYSETGQLDRATFMYELALMLDPSCAEAHNNLGVVYKERDNIDRAAECYLAALSIRPSFPQSLNNLGVVYTSQGRANEALALLTAAIHACPSYAEAHNNLGVLQRDVGATMEAIQSYSKCLELAPDSRNAGQNRLLALNYVYQGDEAHVCDAHKEWGRKFQTLHPRLPPLLTLRRSLASDLDLERTLVIGYLSPDLFTHSVSYFVEAPLTFHTFHGLAGDARNPMRRSIRHIVYSCVHKPDTKTVRLRAATEAAGGRWVDVARLSELNLAKRIQEDGVDILVELTGHTANNRLGTMAMKPAPIQVTWIGYPNSTGLEAIDYRITDLASDPLDSKQSYVEELIRLPNCFLCYMPASESPPVSQLPCIENGFVTFGSFNNMAKITPTVIKCWAQILHRVPNSRLVLKNKPFACEMAKAHILNVMSSLGIAPSRVDLLPLAPSNYEHLSSYSIVDISLDPYPYAGTTTTCESLFMGVPCITLRGRGHAHNVGVSLLSAIGLHKDGSKEVPGVDWRSWVADTEEEYVDTAVYFASRERVVELAEVRRSLRERMLASPLCDGRGFVANLEKAYREMWLKYVMRMKAEGLDKNDLGGPNLAGSSNESGATTGDRGAFGDEACDQTTGQSSLSHERNSQIE